MEHLYDAALKDSSKRTYKTGQRAYLRFTEEVNKKEALAPFHPQSLNKTELYLAFYIAYLVLRPTIKKGSTILAYVGHVKYLFREQGCPPEAYGTPFLGQVHKGVKNVFPIQPDKREAFFLPLHFQHPNFAKAATKPDYLLRLATELEFFGMLRPHTFTTLGPQSCTFVLKEGHVRQQSRGEHDFCQFLRDLPDKGDMLGFFCAYKSKTMDCARAYFPNLGSS